jgi:hypothetical protein
VRVVVFMVCHSDEKAIVLLIVLDYYILIIE